MPAPCPRRPGERARRLNALTAFCLDRGVALTARRRAVLEIVACLDTHPTADEILASARSTRRRLGRATAYRALGAFAAAGVLAKACHPGTGARCDARLERHHYLVCTRCGRMVDLSNPVWDALEVPDLRRLGFSVTGAQARMRGPCGPCRKKERKRKEAVP